jgi:hypothetical protein
MGISLRRLMICAAGLLAAASGFGCSTAPSSDAPHVQTAALDQDARQEVAEALADRLEQDYADAELGKQMAVALRSRLAAGVYSKMPSVAFAAALEKDLRAISHDVHLEVKYQPSLGEPEDPDEGAEEAEAMRKSAGGLSRLDLIDEGDIGYLALYEFAPPQDARSALAAIFKLLANTDALIVDLRENEGGSPPGVALVASFLIGGPPQTLNTIHIRPENQIRDLKSVDVGDAAYGAAKPIYILVSNRTFSGAEALAYDLQAMKRAMLVGETTRGGGNITRPQPLGHDFMAVIPFARVTSPLTGADWEGVGVKPDIVVRSDKALDLALERARERISKAPR